MMNEKIKSFKSEEEFYSYFKQENVSLTLAIDMLIKSNTALSMYVIVRMLCVDAILNRFGWKKPDRKFILGLMKTHNDYSFFSLLHPNLLCVLQSGVLPIQGLIYTPIKELTYADFYKHFFNWIKSKRVNFNRSIEDSFIRISEKKQLQIKNKKDIATNVFENYEHGLSDW